jgi:hypothetical protein
MNALAAHNERAAIGPHLQSSAPIVFITSEQHYGFQAFGDKDVVDGMRLHDAKDSRQAAIVRQRPLSWHVDQKAKSNNTSNKQRHRPSDVFEQAGTECRGAHASQLAVCELANQIHARGSGARSSVQNSKNSRRVNAHSSGNESTLQNTKESTATTAGAARNPWPKSLTCGRVLARPMAEESCSDSAGYTAANWTALRCERAALTPAMRLETKTRAPTSCSLSASSKRRLSVTAAVKSASANDLSVWRPEMTSSNADAAAPAAATAPASSCARVAVTHSSRSLSSTSTSAGPLTSRLSQRAASGGGRSAAESVSKLVQHDVAKASSASAPRSPPRARSTSSSACSRCLLPAQSEQAATLHPGCLQNSRSVSPASVDTSIEAQRKAV